ncbi:hypothetical protein DEDE109153_16570 [Deinococcus deserti]
MQVLRQAHRFEYRNSQGRDQLATTDVWADHSGQQALLVLRDAPCGQAPHALRALHGEFLCYLLHPEASVQVVILGCQPGSSWAHMPECHLDSALLQDEAHAFFKSDLRNHGA